MTQSDPRLEYSHASTLDRRQLLWSMAAPLAAPALARAASSPIEVFEIDSRMLGTRRVSTYRPPDWRPEQRYPVIYAADGQALGTYAEELDRLVRTGRVRPTVMVAPWAAEPKGGVDLRGLEYLVGSDDGGRAFSRHERFFIDEIMPFAEGRLGAATTREDRAVFGFSNGAAWSLSMAMRHRQMFGQAVVFSLGWSLAGAAAAAGDRPRLFLAAGNQEPFFLATTRQTATVARGSPVEVVLRLGQGEHGPDLWRSLFPEAATWAFGPPAKG